jgi:hypothetical protein
MQRGAGAIDAAFSEVERSVVGDLQDLFQQIGLIIVNTVEFSTHCDQI